jgi:WD40 repeat protein
MNAEGEGGGEGRPGRVLRGVTCGGFFGREAVPSCLITYDVEAEVEGQDPRRRLVTGHHSGEAGMNGGTVMVWDRETFGLLRSFDGAGGIADPTLYTGGVLCMAAYREPAGGHTRLLVAAQRELGAGFFSALTAFDPETGTLVRRVGPQLRGNLTHMVCFAVGGDGGEQPRQARVAVGGELDNPHMGAVLIYDPEAAALVHTIQTAGQDVGGLACFEASWGDHQLRLATGGFDSRVQVWSAESGALDRECGPHDCWSLVTYVEPVHGRQRIVTAGFGNAIRVDDAESGEIVRVLEGHEGLVLALLTYESAGRQRHLLSASQDNTIRIWAPEEEAGQLLHIVGGPGVDLTNPALCLYVSGTRYCLALARTQDDGFCVMDLEEAPPDSLELRPANKLG